MNCDKVKVPLVCTACGAEYYTVVTRSARHAIKKRKYCDDCLREHYLKNAEATRSPHRKTCEICGEDFATYTSGKYCSDACKRIAKNERNRRWKQKQKVSPYYLARGNTCAARGDSLSHSIAEE